MRTQDSTGLRLVAVLMSAAVTGRELSMSIRRFVSPGVRTEGSVVESGRRLNIPALL